MNTGELINNLQGLGYQLSLDEENLHFQYTGTGDPPGGAAILLEELRDHKPEVLDYLRLLDTPQSKLEKPILIESGYLKNRLYLVANEAQAQKIEEAGSVCYLPEEVGVLLANSTGMDEGALKDYLKKIHAVKTMFPGARVRRVL